MRLFPKKISVLALAAVILISSAGFAGEADDSQYDEGRFMNIGGRIVKVSFEKDYTKVTLKVIDEEDTVYLPPKDQLGKAGVKADQLKPGNLFEANGHPHKTDKMKMKASDAKISVP